MEKIGRKIDNSQCSALIKPNAVKVQSKFYDAVQRRLICVQ